MNTFQIQKLYNDINEIKNFYNSYGTYFENYEQVCQLLFHLTNELEKNLSYSIGKLEDNNSVIFKRLENQTSEQRLNFVNLTKLHEEDVENLSKLLIPFVSSNVPVLDLFPGCGQFLPFCLAAEPLFVADRYIEICEHAGNILQNDFYKNRRLRKYEIKDWDTLKLPQEQFGLIYCFNEFYYADSNYILKWAKSVFDLLYSGGRFIFNFMPFDEIWAQEANVQLDFTVINYKKLIEDLKNLGYTIENFKIQKYRSSYMILKKPGIEDLKFKIMGNTAEIIDL